VRDKRNARDTHDGAKLQEAFPPAEARRLLDKLEFHDTTRHGSGVTMAGTEIRIRNGQCLDVYIGRHPPEMRKHDPSIEAWQDTRTKFTSASTRVCPQDS
jgi:hypothetical protein